MKDKTIYKIKSKWHNISIRTEDFEKLLLIQKMIPIRASVPQTVEWLIGVGLKSLNNGVKKDDNTPRIPK